MDLLFDYLCNVTAYDIIFCCCRPVFLKHVFYETAHLYHVQALKITSQAWSKFTENIHLQLVFSIQTFTGLVTSFLWLQNSIDQAVS